MADEATKMRAAIINSFLDVPQPFHGSFGVITQPSGREIYSAQIIPVEQLPSIHDFPDVDECIHKERHEEANNIDDVRLGEYYIHAYGKKRKKILNCAKKDLTEQDHSITKREKNNWRNRVTCVRHCKTHKHHGQQRWR